MSSESLAKVAKSSQSTKGGSKKGERRGGRVAGTPNKLTKDLRESILAAATAAHKDGLVGYLTEQATMNPNSFMGLLGKTLPKEVTGKDGKDLFPTKIKIELVNP